MKENDECQASCLALYTSVDEFIVLWMDRWTAPDQPKLPSDRLEHLADGSRVLAVVDDVANLAFAGVENLRSRLAWSARSRFTSS